VARVAVVPVARAPLEAAGMAPQMASVTLVLAPGVEAAARGARVSAASAAMRVVPCPVLELGARNGLAVRR